MIGFASLAFASASCGSDGSGTDDGSADGPPTTPQTDIDCAPSDSTWQGIQKVVFDGYGCTSPACHGKEGGEGGLDLRPDVAYENLYRVEATANLGEPMQRVFPGEQAFSFLYQKLQAATEGTDLPEGGGDPMPVGVSPITPEHLEAMRLWIRAGAPEDGIVEGTSDLLACGLSNDFTPNKLEPPPPPTPGEGLQFISGPWTVEAGTEDEVCYATYYDLTQTPELVPDWARQPCSSEQLAGQECWTYNRRQLHQDAQSHHSIINAYYGDVSPIDPSWGTWECLNGPHQGTPCDPTKIGISVTEGGADCGELSACGTVPISGPVCAGVGPSDRRTNSRGMGGAQSPISTSKYPDGVYSELPMKGIITWNSHAFNLSEQDTTVEQYNNFWFAHPDQRVYLSHSIFEAKDIFVAEVPPFEQRTYCATFTLPQYARLMGISSHAHKRGWLWQTWLPPNSTDCTVSNGCMPYTDREPEYLSRIYNDPLNMGFDPPLAYDDPSDDTRTLKYCVTYDNGQEDRSLVKRNSTSIGSTCIGEAFGVPVAEAYCIGGPNEGDFCGDDDSLCGEGGECDACTVYGGLTTEDEMFILLGGFYVQPPQ